MPAVRFTKEDFLAGKVVKPGYYHSLVKNVTTKPAKKDQSDVYNIQLRIVESGDYKGVPLTDYISEKAVGTAIPYIKACNGGKEPAPDESYLLENGVNKILKVLVGNSLYNGKITNTINDYLPADAGFVAEED